jgi:hypothetical protein
VTSPHGFGDNCFESAHLIKLENNITIGEYNLTCYHQIPLKQYFTILSIVSLAKYEKKSSAQASETVHLYLVKGICMIFSAVLIW